MPDKNGSIRVLIVDDSALARDMIRSILESEPGITVAGEAENGAEAIARTIDLKPDIVTMDIEMPVMGGLEAIERIIAVHPTPILVVTALTGVRTAFAAVSKGALDVIEKPDISIENMRHLIHKIRLLARVDVTAHRQAMGRKPATSHAHVTAVQAGLSQGKIVAVAASTGGPQAINSILSHLPASYPAPIIISQHIAEGFTQGMAEWLNSGTHLKVVVAANGDRVAPGHVYVNPAEHSMRLTAQGIVILDNREKGLIYHPSCDTMLDSVGRSYGERAIGVILSGMGDDGVVGMQTIRKAGGFTIAQDEKSSVVYGMNRGAVESGCINRVLGLVDIPNELLACAGSL
ncbi:MAG: hypothetical protein A2X80_08075 [Geobacteraceae bacterium GWB2_52_12]|nr:MAG: hypothetical protein A2X80_08075 [Geobacteraceae bacterium GWB2_52_12]